jgi:hypothetical protein
MVSEWNEDWYKYTDTLSIVKDSQILGTFFSKKDFTFGNNNNTITITGNDIIWIQTVNDDYFYIGNKKELSIIDESKLFRKKMNSSEKDKIYTFQNLDFKEHKITITITQNSNNSPEVTTTTTTTTVPAIKIETSNKTSDLLKRAKDLIQSMNTHISNTFEQNKQTVGGSNESLIGDTSENEFQVIKNLVKSFETFVDSYITHPTVLKLNSLSSNDIKSLFDTINSDFNITSKQETFSVKPFSYFYFMDLKLMN